MQISINNILAIEWRRIWPNCIARTEGKKSTYKISFRKSENRECFWDQGVVWERKWIVIKGEPEIVSFSAVFGRGIVE
jgi:hypothetical protein